MTQRHHAWEAHVGPDERAVMADYDAPPVAMRSPAVLLVDLYNKAFGDRREPIERSIQRFPSSCGEAAWDALPVISELLAAAREHGAPVAYSTAEPRPEARVGTATRRARRSDDDWSLAIVEPLAPRAGEVVVYKNAPSAFFGTALATHLHRVGADGVVIAGETTSGCVRATAVDAYSYGFDVVVVEDGCFDRVALSHAASLFDLHHKYATVMFSDEVVARWFSADPPGR